MISVKMNGTGLVLPQSAVCWKKATNWSVAEAEANRQDVKLEVDLYQELGCGVWWTVDDALEQLQQILNANPEAKFSGEAPFDACADWDSDNPEDLFGTIFPTNPPTVAWGVRVYNPHKLEQAKRFGQLLASYLQNDAGAAEPGYMPEALAAAGITKEDLYALGLNWLAEEL